MIDLINLIISNFWMSDYSCRRNNVFFLCLRKQEKRKIWESTRNWKDTNESLL